MKRNSIKPVLLSGIQPTGNLTIGNYIGALKHWDLLQETHDCLFVLADLHAITVQQDPAELLRRCHEFAALLLACGIDSKKNIIFVQSHVPGHTQLLWALNCFVHMGELYRMTQFKDKTGRHERKINVGLFDYPVLMAADILLYKTDLVPVGDDQQQHLEFTRRIALRFNHRYGDIFQIPKYYIPPAGKRIMGLQEPLAKMSKSGENSKNYLALLDTPQAILSKIRQAVTDSEKEIRYNPSRPGIANLMIIYSCLADLSMASIQRRYEGKGYNIFKDDLAEIIIDFLNPLQKRYRSILTDRAELTAMLKKGAKEAHRRSQIMVNKVYDALGLMP